MQKKIWFYLCIIQTVVIIVFIGGLLFISLPELTAPEYELVDSDALLNSLREDNNFIPDEGYIPDAHTAKVVGGEIIDRLTGKTFGRATTVEYDELNRRWIVHKNYFLNGGAFVVIEQDSGKVIKALLYK